MEIAFGIAYGFLICLNLLLMCFGFNIIHITAYAFSWLLLIAVAGAHAVMTMSFSPLLVLLIPASFVILPMVYGFCFGDLPE